MNIRDEILKYAESKGETSWRTGGEASKAADKIEVSMARRMEPASGGVGVLNPANQQSMNAPTKSAICFMDQQSHNINVAREGILVDLRRRWKDNESGVTASSDTSRFYKPQTNYFCGSGEMDCPVCLSGKLKYERSSYNGHVRACCSTKGCVAWIE